MAMILEVLPELSPELVLMSPGDSIWKKETQLFHQLACDQLHEKHLNAFQPGTGTDSLSHLVKEVP